MNKQNQDATYILKIILVQSQQSYRNTIVEHFMKNELIIYHLADWYNSQKSWGWLKLWGINEGVTISEYHTNN